MNLLNWIISFFILAVIASILGFGGLAGTFAEVARVIAIVFIVLFLGGLVYRLLTGRAPPAGPVA